MAGATPVRPDYVDGQFLDADDFTTEQQYHLAMLRRHHIAHHTAGTVTGLQIAINTDSGTPFVGPGVGIDSCGRALIVTERLPLRGDLFLPGGPDAYDVVLLYDRLANGGDGTRWIEQTRVDVVAPTGPGAGPPAPSSFQLSFGPTDEPPDDPAEQAPLFVGQIRRPDRDGDPPIIDQSGRPYVELVASAIAAPQGTARLELGGGDAAFALYTGSDPSALARRLAVAADGQLTADDAVTVAGGLTVGAQLELAAGSEQAGWGLQLVQDDKQSTTELRVQMDLAGGPRTRSTVIGCWSQSGSFTPLLTIGDDGTVTVHGDMIVSGTVHAAGGVVPAQLSSQASQFAAGAITSGVGAAGGLIDKVTSGSFTPRPPSTPTAVQQTATQLAAHLSQNPAHAETFAQEIKSKGEHLVQPLIDALRRV